MNKYTQKQISNSEHVLDSFAFSKRLESDNILLTPMHCRVNDQENYVRKTSDQIHGKKIGRIS